MSRSWIRRAGLGVRCPALENRDAPELILCLMLSPSLSSFSLYIFISFPLCAAILSCSQNRKRNKEPSGGNEEEDTEERNSARRRRKERKRRVEEEPARGQGNQVPGKSFRRRHSFPASVRWGKRGWMWRNAKRDWGDKRRLQKQTTCLDLSPKPSPVLDFFAFCAQYTNLHAFPLVCLLCINTRSMNGWGIRESWYSLNADLEFKPWNWGSKT